MKYFQIIQQEVPLGAPKGWGPHYDLYVAYKPDVKHSHWGAIGRFLKSLHLAEDIAIMYSDSDDDLVTLTRLSGEKIENTIGVLKNARKYIAIAD